MKFAFLSDTHLAAAPMMFSQQKGYPEKLNILIKLLAEKLKDEDVSFVLHSGDIIDKTSPENIIKASDIFSSLGVPVYLSLGNHDVTEPDSYDLWKKHGGFLFPNGEPEYTISDGHLRIHVISTHWEDKLYYWATRQDAHFLSDRVKQLQDELNREPDAIHIICTHSPVFPVPAEQTGFDSPFHNPGSAFNNSVLSITDNCAGLKCVLSGHNHVNSCREYNGVYYVTASSFSETPFEFKIFDFDDKILSMKTVSLFQKTTFGYDYDFNRAFIQGREKDRSFNVPYKQ